MIAWLYDAAGTKLRKTTFSSILTLNDDPIAPGTYQSNEILSSGRVAGGSAVTFSAESGITLAAGFEVAASAEFLAKIEPAGPPTGVAREYSGGIEYYNGTLEAIPRPPKSKTKEDTTPKGGYPLTMGNRCMSTT